MIYGLGIYNMKGALVCYVHAVKALLEAGVKLDGDIILGAVCGEIEKTQWGEFQGKEYRGYGAGTHYLVNHGVLPDMCILGEPTDMQLVLEHAGSMWVRFGLTGNYVHSAFAPGKEDQNAIRRMYDVVGEVMRWIPEWQEQAHWAGRPGFVNIGCLQAGHPWRASRTPERADLFLDVRVPPTISMTDARRAAKKLYLALKEKHPEYGLEFETYVSVPGATIDREPRDGKSDRAKSSAHCGKAPGTRYRAVVFGRLGAVALRLSDIKLWPIERTTRSRGREGRDQDAGRYYEGVRADRGGVVRRKIAQLWTVSFKVRRPHRAIRHQLHSNGDELRAHGAEPRKAQQVTRFICQVHLKFNAATTTSAPPCANRVSMHLSFAATSTPDSRARSSTPRASRSCTATFTY